jgi:tetratricopeptide (TPR) repeat protein
MEKPFRSSVYIVILIVFAFTASCRLVKKEGGLSERRTYENSYLYISALQLKLTGRTNEALEIFTKIAASDPKHSASRYETARLYAERLEFSTAVDYVKQAIKIDPKNKWYRLLLIDINERSGDKKSNVALYQQLIKEFPRDMSLYYGLANTHMQLNNVNAAINVMNDIESKIGVSEEISLQKYQFYVMTGNNKAAIEEIRKLARAFPGEISYTMAIGDFYLQTGNYYEAMVHYSAVLEQDNQNYEALISLAECYMRIGNTSKATQLFTTLFADPAISVDAKMNIMMYYYEVSPGDTSLLNQSYRLLDLYLNTHPDDAKVYTVYGDFLFRDQQYEEAAKKWEKVNQMDPSKFPVWEHLFMCYDMLKAYDKLATTAIRCIEYFPEQSGGYFYAGYALYKEEEYSRSISYLEDAAEMTVTNKTLRIQVLGYLAEAYHSLKKHELSDSTFEKLIEIDPKNNWALNNYSYYLALRGKNLEHALKMSEKTIKSNPKSPSYLDTYGWILYQMGRYDEAKEFIERAVEYSSEPGPAILQNYGDVLFKLGKPDESLKFWKLAIEAGGDKQELQQRIDQLKTHE